MSRFEPGTDVIVTNVGGNYSGPSGRTLSEHCDNGVLGCVVHKPEGLNVLQATLEIVDFVHIQGHTYCIGSDCLELAPDWMVRSDTDRDGSWISWGGGDCPFPHNTRTEVWLRQYDHPQEDIRRASGWRWNHSNNISSGDIIFYREVGREEN